jgi:hypothetical protein
MSIPPPRRRPCECGITTNDSMYSQVRELAQTLLDEAEELQKSQKLATADQQQQRSPSPNKPDTSSLLRTSSNASTVSRLSTIGVPPKLQKAKIDEAMAMVEREAAVIEAVMRRLERLCGR